MGILDAVRIKYGRLWQPIMGFDQCSNPTKIFIRCQNMKHNSAVLISGVRLLRLRACADRDLVCYPHDSSYFLSMIWNVCIISIPTS